MKKLRRRGRTSQRKRRAEQRKKKLQMIKKANCFLILKIHLSLTTKANPALRTHVKG
jgi:hypothetical protein